MSLENLSSGMCNQVTLKMACSSVEARRSFEILDIASMDIIPSMKRITDVQADLCLCGFGPGHAKTCLMPYANNKGADQPAHPRSLISTFVVRCLNSLVCILAIPKVSRF